MTADEPASTTEEMTDEARLHKEYPDSTYMVISKIAYLAGVPREIFEDSTKSPQMEWFNSLEKDKNARIIRNLCMIRTAIEHNYKKLNQAMTYDLKNLDTLPEYIPQGALRTLRADGIALYRANCKLNQYLIDINGHINNRINNIKGLFPIWLEWSYIRELFIMPAGNTEAGIKKAATEFYGSMSKYPYGVYINWASSTTGNILINDKRFVTLLYQEHEDYFYDLSKISDAGYATKQAIYDFLENSTKTNLVVDCENSDPYRLYAMLHNLNEEALLSKINKITLYDDSHTTSAWDILDDFTGIPIEHIETERLLEHKSQVDAHLIAGTVTAHYRDGVDSFILASSDSDYWAMISDVPTARFLVAVESGLCSPTLKQRLENGGYTYCYLNDFCTGNSNQLKVQAMLKEVRSCLESSIHINVQDMLREAYTATRAEMSDAEQRQFYDRYIKPMKLRILSDGTLSIELGS